MRRGGLSKWFFGLLAIIFFSAGSQAKANVTWVMPDSIPASQVPAGFHFVQKGDTYYRLSRLYQVPVDSLQAWNGPALKLSTTVRVKPAAGNTKATGLKVIKPVPDVIIKTPAPPAQVTRDPETKPIPPAQENAAVFTAPKTAQRVVVIPFDPALYFSDADADIAWQSKIPKQKVRYIFQQRLTALLKVPGFQTVNLLSGGPDAEEELNRIYKGVNYSYQDITYGSFKPVPPPQEKGFKAWVKNAKAKVSRQEAAGPVGVAHDEGKYYEVQVKDPELLASLNQTYQTDYYVFINQFEIFTDYTNCIDRTTQNFLRNFRVHYSIYDAKGELLAGNKVLIPYVSNINDIDIICRENLGKLASRILEDVPHSQAVSEIEVAN